MLCNFILFLIRTKEVTEDFEELYEENEELIIKNDRLKDIIRVTF